MGGINSIANLRIRDLKTAGTTTDSLKILLDVYNLSDKLNRDMLRGHIIELTQRSDSQEVIDEVLRELVTSTDMADDLERLLEISQSLPDSADKESLQTIIKMEHAASESSNVLDSQLIDQVAEYTRRGLMLGSDPYEEIQNIYRAMSYLGSTSQGPLYFKYINRLEELVNELPDSDRAIKNLFYTTAAIYYTRKRDFKKAISLDRKLIKQLDEMSDYYKQVGDNTHNLNNFYYLSYRRMLRNFMGLTPEEVEDIYNKCVELARRDEQINETFGKVGLSNAYYHLAKKEYTKAIPYLYKALSNENISKYRRRELLGHLAKALRETGDKRELEVLREYTDMLWADKEETRNDMYREIELRNSVTKIINEEYRKEEKIRNENRVMRKTSVTIVYVLSIILIFLIAAYIRLRNRLKEVEQRNKKLHRNIEDIFDDGVPKGTRELSHKINKLKG